jgi:toxin ParE1/3/4
VAHKVVFRPTARADLKSLYLYIADEAGDERAGVYLGRLEVACMSLQTLPERGSVRDRVLPGLRIIGFERSASIAFRVTGDTVEILRILQRGRDIPAECRTISHHVFQGALAWCPVESGPACLEIRGKQSGK